MLRSHVISPQQDVQQTNIVIPAWAQAARWPPQGSRIQRHRQRRVDRSNARWGRLRSRIRKICGWYVLSGSKGVVVNARLACGPEWESNTAWLTRLGWRGRDGCGVLAGWAACRCPSLTEGWMCLVGPRRGEGELPVHPRWEG